MQTTVCRVLFKQKLQDWLQSTLVAHQPTDRESLGGLTCYNTAAAIDRIHSLIYYKKKFAEEMQGKRRPHICCIDLESRTDFI
jgi:hypothetical protein